jgi:hypothetical protein
MSIRRTQWTFAASLALVSPVMSSGQSCDVDFNEYYRVPLSLNAGYSAMTPFGDLSDEFSAFKIRRFRLFGTSRTTGHTETNRVRPVIPTFQVSRKEEGCLRSTAGGDRSTAGVRSVGPLPQPEQILFVPLCFVI